MPSLMGWAVVALLSVAGGAFVYSVFALVPKRNTVGEMLNPTTDDRKEDRPSFAEAFAKSVPSGYAGWVQKKIIHGGKSAEWSVGGFLLFQLGIAIFGLLVGVLGFLLLEGFLKFLGVLFGFLFIVYPSVVLTSRADDRQKAIQLALADTLDQMTIAVEAGLGFEAAMSRTAHGGKGPLAEELIRTLQDMQIGRSRTDAYEALLTRTHCDDLRRFVRAFQQADRYGIGIADVLRVQAGEMRLKRRQRAEESAMKVPVKVVFPLVFAILPTLFIVLLFPAILGIIKAFS